MGGPLTGDDNFYKVNYFGKSIIFSRHPRGVMVVSGGSSRRSPRKRYGRAERFYEGRHYLVFRTNLFQ